MVGRPCLALRRCECPEGTPEEAYSADCRACRTRAHRLFREDDRTDAEVAFLPAYNEE